MEHTALLKDLRDLRKSLRDLPTAALIMAPGLKAAVPLIDRVLEGFSDVTDRVALLEQRMAAFERLPPPDVIRTLTAAT